MVSAIKRDGSELEEIIEKIDMEYWLNREAVEYKVARGSRGVQLHVKECPVCGNSKWKVYLNQENGLGNCFHGDCEAKFSKWSFIKASLGNLSNREVVEHMRTVVGEQGYTIKKTEFVPMTRGDLKLPKSTPLPIQGRNVKYLSDRGINLNTVRDFKLRLCAKGWFEYKDVDGTKKLQSYSKRIIIPIFNLNGELVSYQGRDITGTSEKKYLFPPGFASTGSIIYNGSEALGFKDICIGEGAFDVMAIHQAFQEDDALCNVAAVGSFGKHLSYGDEHSQLAQILQMKDEGLERVTFMWDGEKRALLDAIESALMVAGLGLTARVAVLPSGKDPNEVEPSVVREAYLKATTITPSESVKLKLKLGVI
jgi:DNA primase